VKEEEGESTPKPLKKPVKVKVEEDTKPIIKSEVLLLTSIITTEYKQALGLLLIANSGLRNAEEMFKYQKRWAQFSLEENSELMLMNEVMKDLEEMERAGC